jgi:phosphorylcholine metabolism protein LicD
MLTSAERNNNAQIFQIDIGITYMSLNQAHMVELVVDILRFYIFISNFLPTTKTNSTCLEIMAHHSSVSYESVKFV